MKSGRAAGISVLYVGQRELLEVLEVCYFSREGGSLGDSQISAAALMLKRKERYYNQYHVLTWLSFFQYPKDSTICPVSTHPEQDQME